MELSERIAIAHKRGTRVNITYTVMGETKTFSARIVQRNADGSIDYTKDGVWFSTAKAGSWTQIHVYTATRIAQRFYEFIGKDEFVPGDYDIEDLSYDTVAELVHAVRSDYVTFIINYATGVREVVSWHFSSNVSIDMLTRVIIPAVNRH